MDVDPLSDLVNQAEQLTAEISSEPTFPRVERNLKQLAEVGQQLWSRTALHAPRQTSDVRASVLLGSKGYDLQKVSHQLEQLSGAKKSTPVETLTETDTQGFLKNERENAIMSVVEEVKKISLKSAEKLYWDNLHTDWESEKRRILNALVAPDKESSLIEVSTGTAPPVAVEPSATLLNEQEIDEFVHSVSNLIREKKMDQVNRLIGFISDDGCRIPGELNRNHDADKANDIILRVAAESEQQGFFDDAIQLYDLASEHEKVLRLLNRLLSTVLADKQEPGSQRESLENLSLRLAERYSSHGHTSAKETVNTFYLLLDLMTFFSYYHKQAFNDALDTVEKLKIIPLRNSEIDLKVGEFSVLPEEIRRNIAEILLATMNILYAQYKEAKSCVPQSVNKFGIASDASFREQRCQECREKARILITFAGMIPYRMPGNTNAKLVQLEVLMN